VSVEDLAQAPQQHAVGTAGAGALTAARDRVESPALWLDITLSVLLFAFAIVPRAAWVAYNDRPPQGLNDPTLYSLFADIMADGDGYTRPTGEPFAYYPVGFPATVAGLKKASDLVGAERSIFQVKMMNGVFGAITVVLVYLLASRMIDRRTGVVAGALLGVFPSQIFYTGTFLSEALFTMLLVASVLALAWKPWSRDGMPYGQLALAGLLLSAATMTRGITLVFPLLLCLIWLFYLRSKTRALLQTAVLFAGIAVFVAPWTARNITAFDTFVGPSTNVGDDLCIGNFAGSDGRFTLFGKCFESTEGLPPQKVEIERNREGLRIAIEDRLADPIGTVPLVARKAYWLLYQDDDGLWAAESYGNDYFISHPRREILSFTANAVYYATGALAVLGVAAFALARDVRRLFVLATMLYVLAVPLAFFGDPRFHYPAMPFAIIIAAAIVVWLWDRRGLAIEEAVAS
jgi:4-amino-4-deoxy-L-arabinose transferase-like glycosyltransferase